MNVNASNDLRKFNFYQEYVWSPTDFLNFQTWIMGMFRAAQEGAFGASVLGGLEPNPPGGLDVEVLPGIAVNEYGRQLVHNAAASVTLAPDGSNPRRSLVVLRPVDTSMTNITEPLNPPTQVPLHVKEEYQLLVIAGTAAATPQYPAKQAGDVILFGVKLDAAHANILITDIDYSVTERPRARRKKIVQIAQDYQASPEDEIIEVSCTGGDVTVTLSVAASAPGREVRCVKIDATGNSMFVDGNGGEQISEQDTLEVDTQWDKVEAYSNGIDGWRHF